MPRCRPVVNVEGAMAGTEGSHRTRSGKTATRRGSRDRHGAVSKLRQCNPAACGRSAGGDRASTFVVESRAAIDIEIHDRAVGVAGQGMAKLVQCGQRLALRVNGHGPGGEVVLPVVKGDSIQGKRTPRAGVVVRREPGARPIVRVGCRNRVSHICLETVQGEKWDEHSLPGHEQVAPDAVLSATL